MKYAVHLYTQVRVKVVGVEAESMAHAMEMADSAVNFHELLDYHRPCCPVDDGLRAEDVEFADAMAEYACIDPVLDNGEIDYAHSTCLDSNGQTLVEGKTIVERQAKACEDAKQFMQELLDSVETLSGIADTDGARTLADLMFLQQAVLSGGFIDHCTGESNVLGIASSLPSGTQWTQYIQVDYMAS